MVVDFLFAASSSSASSTDGFGVFIAILVVVVVIAYVVFSSKFLKARAEQVATARGWSYTKRDDSVLDRFATWPFFLGRRRRAKSVISGVFEGHNVTLFNFEFRNSQGGLAVGAGPITVPVDGKAKRDDTGIFAGYDSSLGVVTGRSSRRMFDRGDGAAEGWGICVMEMPGTLTPMLVRPTYAADTTSGLFSDAIGVTNDGARQRRISPWAMPSSTRSSSCGPSIPRPRRRSYRP